MPIGVPSAPTLLAAFSGLLLVFSFPHLGNGTVAWVALAPLLVAVAGVSPGKALRLGLLTGIVHFAGTIYWIPDVMVSFGGLPRPAAWGVHALFVLVLAAFPALFAAALADLVTRHGSLAIFLAPAVWVTTELGRMYLFTGFPWTLVGYSQMDMSMVAQTASIVGVLGVSVLVLSLNAAVAYLLVAGVRAKVVPLAATALVWAAAVGFGAWRLADSSLLGEGSPLRVAALQGNIAQDDKWDPRSANAIIDTYLDQTREAVDRGAALVVWPEAATPYPFDRDPRAEDIRAMARSSGTHLLIGTTEVSLDERDETNYYNAAYLLDDAGGVAAVYRKQHLVPFGEYVPFRDLLFFISPLVETVGAFTPGDDPTTLPVGARPIGTAICYEMIYPALVRELVLAGSQLLTTITNDAWYGRSAAPHQHFQQAAMRAIEEGRFVVRAANTGISGIVDPYGRVMVRSALFEPAILVGEVRLLDNLTVYGRIGDLPAYVLAAITVAALVRRRRGQRADPPRGGTDQPSAPAVE